MICKFTVREDIAKEDVAGIGYEYELYPIPDEAEFLYVCFTDPEGIPRRWRYTKTSVDAFFANGTWIKSEE